VSANFGETLKIPLFGAFFPFSSLFFPFSSRCFAWAAKSDRFVETVVPS